MSEYIYTVEEGTKGNLEKDAGENTMSFECEQDDVDTAYDALAESIQVTDSDDKTQEENVVDFENAKDDDVETLLNDMEKMGFIGYWSKQKVDE